MERITAVAMQSVDAPLDWVRRTRAASRMPEWCR
jgi:hypothetical protein